MERIPEMMGRLERLERDLAELPRFWKSSVDDIKAIIKAEISDLKAEQIADLRLAIKDRERQIADMDSRVRGLESVVQAWIANQGFLQWMIKTAIALAALLAGYFGGRHLG